MVSFWYCSVKNGNMRIVILTTGSRGDVQPYIALGLGLKSKGHNVCILTHDEFKDFIIENGLEFAYLAGSPKEAMESKDGISMTEAGENPVKVVLALIELGKPFAGTAMQNLWDSCKNADALICSTLSFVGFHITEKMNIPTFYAILQPTLRTNTMPYVGTPPKPFPVSLIYNKLTYLSLEQLLWQPTRKLTNQLRKEILDLPPSRFFGLYDALYKKISRVKYSPVPSLCGFSPSFVSKPSDWKEWMHITGYWFLENNSGWKPSQELSDFIESGESPVYIGFGSMNNSNSEKTTNIVINALKKSKKRGILVTGWGGLKTKDFGKDIFVADSIPHDWLFPKMSAVVHHGGAGTTSAGLKAGIPTVVVPFFGDQIYWGERVFITGVGPKPIPHKELNEDNLASAIEKAVSDQEIRNRAKLLGEKIRNENGVENAVSIFEKYF